MKGKEIRCVVCKKPVSIYRYANPRVLGRRVYVRMGIGPGRYRWEPFGYAHIFCISPLLAVKS